MSERKTAEQIPRQYLLHKLHSLTGVVPLGLFLIWHLWLNAHAAGGRRAYTQAVVELQETPYLWLAELLLVLLPLTFHALYGVRMALSSRGNISAYPSTGNWMYVLQRVSGVLTFGFVVFHLAHIRLQVLLGNVAERDLYEVLVSSLSSTSAGVPVYAILYLAGVAAAAFHFSNGLARFCFSWGITASQRSSKIASIVCGVLGIGLFVLGANSVVYLATGSRLVPYALGASTPW